MTYLSDIEIANSVEMKPIKEIAKTVGIEEEQLITYGNFKAKVNVYDTKEVTKKQNGKLILVTAINPTPAGEGKTTTSVGLVDGLNKIGKKAIIALREPSLGPVFGMKGGAAGGGRAQVVPMEDINLHFTGDFHAISVANNLLAALIDNHIHQGNTLQIDNRNISWKRVIDMNDRQLRHMVNGLNGKVNGVPREDGFDITAASEIMAILCLATGPEDLKEKLKKVVIGYNYEGQPVTAEDLKAEGALAAILKDAINPNLVQTLEHSPAIIHGGPFANIAHGCNSVLATKLALENSDYTITEAGFGADLGAEKFFDIKCRLADLNPDAVVVVATIRALKMHGGVAKNELELENTEAVLDGFKNLEKHIDTLKNVFNMPVVVAINKFPLDTENEINVLKEACELKHVSVVLSDVWASGGEGGVDLAKKVVELTKMPHQLTYAYELDDSIEDKLTKIVQRVYGGKGIELTNQAKKQLKQLEALGYSDLPICMSKTQYSLSDDPTKIGAPKDFIVTIRQLKLAAGAGFIVALTGAIMTMPGLPKSPAAERIDIEANGDIVGLF